MRREHHRAIGSATAAAAVAMWLLAGGSGGSELAAQPSTEVSSHYQASYDAEALGRMEAALEALDELPRAERDTYVYQLRRGWLLYLVGRYDDAISWYERAAASAPGAIEPLLGLMLPQMALLRWQDAEQTASRALEIDPLNFLARRRLALVQYSLGRYPEAEQLYRDVLQLYPADVEVRSGLGWSLLRQGDRAGATAEFETVLRVAPNQPSAREGLQAAER